MPDPLSVPPKQPQTEAQPDPAEALRLHLDYELRDAAWRGEWDLSTNVAPLVASIVPAIIAVLVSAPADLLVRALPQVREAVAEERGGKWVPYHPHPTESSCTPDCRPL